MHNPKSVEFHQCRAKRHSICFYHSIKDNERNLYQNLLTTENTDSDLKVRAREFHVNAPVNSSCALPPPPHPGNYWEFAFFLIWMADSQGWWHLSCQMSGSGDKNRGKCPAIHNESNALGCEMLQFMHAQGSLSCYIRVRD